MIPLSDVSRRPMGFPIATVSIIVVNFIVFFAELASGNAFVTRWSMIPANIVAGRHLETLLTSMFMHGGWAHILGNMLFLWVFGPEIEDAMGKWRYAIFYLLGGLVAQAAQIAPDPNSKVLCLGASGAIASVMGAFLVTYPRDQIRTVLILGWFIRVTLLPAVLLVGLWFVFQVLSQLGVLGSADQQGGGVAYMAHVGGFLFGALVCRLFEDRQRLQKQAPADAESG